MCTIKIRFENLEQHLINQQQHKLLSHRIIEINSSNNNNRERQRERYKNGFPIEKRIFPPDAVIKVL